MRKKHENRRLILEGNFFTVTEAFYFRNLKHQLYLTVLLIVLFYLIKTSMRLIKYIWNFDATRKHSSRIRAARLPTVHALATRCQYWSSEQVLTGLQWLPPNVTSGGAGTGASGLHVWLGGGLYSEVKCIMDIGHMGKPTRTDRQTQVNFVGER